MRWTTLGLLLTFLPLGQLLAKPRSNIKKLVTTCSRQELLELAPFSKLAGCNHSIPAEILKKRHSGTRAGIKRNRQQRERALRGVLWPTHPSVAMGNICCLKNKMEELEGLTRTQKENWGSSLICLCETWLKDGISDSITTIKGFQTIWAEKVVCLPCLSTINSATLQPTVRVLNS